MTTALDTYHQSKLSIHTSVASGQLYLVQRLIAEGCDPNLPHTTTGLRPIHFAASRGHLELVRYLVESTLSCQLDAVDKEEETALLKAAYANHLKVVSYLVEQGANYNHQDRDGWTALHNACSCGNLEMVKFLCQQPHMDVNITSQQGHTPLMNAASKGFVDIVIWLLKQKANVLMRNNFDETAYDVAAAAHETYICHLLDPQHAIDLHVTIPVILIEQVKHEQHTSYLSLTAPTQTRIVSYYRNQEQITGGKSKVELPNPSWFWLTDWTVDHTFPRMDSAGWSYYHADRDTWSEQLPIHYRRYHIKQRRWVRIMKKASLLTTHVPQQLEEEEAEEGSRRHSANSTQSLNTEVATRTVLARCSTPQPLLQQLATDRLTSWERNDQVLNCRRCHRFFNLLVRRHHCRKCGQIVCDRCSMNRMMLSTEEMVHPPHQQLEVCEPQRICDHCAEQVVIENSKINKKRASMMIECPVCSTSLLDYHSSIEQEQHVQSCLARGSSSAMRYVVYKLNANSTLIGQECVICFEEFRQDDTLMRLNCMCSYHYNCIQAWFSKGKECPVHSQ
ncbi:ankyrin repeat-containing domain protein [Blakeslea trispora]|nr:ankyrin repeat-containing domain protein [Blakeslea trispora]